LAVIVFVDAARSAQEVDVASLWDRSDIAGQLSKDILNRARKSRKEKGSSGTAEISS
jgi:hypothetical protein